MAITAMVGLILWYIGKDDAQQVREREAFAAVGIGWLVIALFGSLPYLFSGTLTSPIDAYFESMSGFATCGATVIRPPAGGADYLDVYTHSIFMWRALTQWVGGLGIIVLSVVILARVMGGAMRLVKAEAAGLTATRLRPKMAQTARLLWGIYALYTGIEIVLLVVLGRVNLYDAVTHSFTTLATGGFGTHVASAAYWNSPLVEGIIAAFVLVGSISFVLHWQAMTGRGRDVLKDPELRFYLFVVVTATILVTANITHLYGNLAEGFRYASFQVISIVGTAGFSNADFTVWPWASQLMLIVLMLMGGCVGSTAGAIKISRILILLKAVRREIHKVLHPRAVIPIRMGKQIISDDVVNKIGIFFFVYIITFLVGTLILLFLDPSMMIHESVSALATTMGGVGPGLGGVAGHMADVTPAGKIFLSLMMWLGRLEILTALILFFPSTYKS